MATVTRPPFGTPSELVSRVAARLDSLFAGEEVGIWVEPVLHLNKQRAQPDLVLGGPSVGPVVAGVFSWGRDGQEVSTAGKGFLRVGAGKGAVSHRHPHEALSRARDVLRAHLGRVPQTAAFEPRTLLWFPFLTDEQARALLQDDIQACDLFLTRDGSTAEAVEAALTAAPGPSLSALKAAVEPQLHFFDLRGAEAAETETEPPPRAEAWGYFLDRKQERMAKELASPRTLVYGPAGSGKTVFLMARAQYWLNGKPGARVLLTCYNASLAAHMRRSLELKGMPVDGERLRVMHYHDLCREILGLGLEFHEREPEFYAALEPRVLKHLSAAEQAPAFDLILVDEGQDFTRRMFDVLIRLAARGGEITVVADPAQDIYLRWSESNLEPLGDYATERLVDCYRNTAPIFALARSVIPAQARKALGLNRLELTRPEDLGRNGPPPVFVELSSLDAWVSHLEQVCASVRARGLPLSQVAVLYTDRHAIPEFPQRLAASRWKEAPRSREFARPEDEEESASLRVGSLNPTESRHAEAPRHFVEALLVELERKGIPAEWVTRDFEAKAAFDIQRPCLVISTIHSAKGMDFDTVLLIGAETLPPADAKAPALLFAGITRAREHLEILSFRPTGWIPELMDLADA